MIGAHRHLDSAALQKRKKKKNNWGGGKNHIHRGAYRLFFILFLFFGTKSSPFSVKAPARLGSSLPVRCGVTERCDHFHWICLPSNNNDAPLRLLTVGRTTEVRTLGECAFTSRGGVYMSVLSCFPFLFIYIYFLLLSTRPSGKYGVAGCRARWRRCW